MGGEGGDVKVYTQEDPETNTLSGGTSQRKYIGIPAPSPSPLTKLPHLWGELSTSFHAFYYPPGRPRGNP